MSFNRILACKPVQKIIFYDCLLAGRGQGQLFTVSKAVKNACETAISQRLCERIEMRDRNFSEASKATVKELCGGEDGEVVLARLYADADKKAQRLCGHLVVHPVRVQQFLGERGAKGATLDTCWKRIQQVHDRYAGEQDPTTKERLRERLIIGLNRVNRQIDLLGIDLLGEYQYHLPQNFAEDPSFPELINLMRQFVAQENLEKNFREALAPQGDNPEPIPSSRKLSALNQHRGNLARITGPGRDRFDAIPHAFSLERFRVGEELALQGEDAQDRALCMLWGNVRDFGPFGMNRAPAIEAPAQTIRDWINAENNAGILAGIRGLNFWDAGVSVLPPEIGRFTSVEALGCGGNDRECLVDLPEELAQLQHLKILHLQRNGFREIPRVLERLRALEDLSLAGNQHPIRVFPDWLADRLESGFSRSMDRIFNNEFYQIYRLDQFLGALGRMDRGNWRLNEQYAGLPHEEFTDIPFRIWFRERCSIPNLPLYMILGMFAGIDRIIDIDRFYRAGWGSFLGGIGLFTAGTLISVPLVLLGMPFFIANLVLNLLVRPLIEEFRYELGYGLVHIRDIPAPPPAPQA